MPKKIISLKSVHKLPFQIKVGSNHYFIVGDQTNGFSLLSSICPHQAGKIKWEGDCFRCPLHNWRFTSCGEGLNASAVMKQQPLELRNDELWLDDDSWLEETFTASKLPTLTSRRLTRDIKVQLLSHACLNLSYNESNILIDPWLEGPAMFGAWRQYPKCTTSTNDLSPDAIVITHEHSDHFHLPTLRKFSRKTPIYFPSFSNKRIEYFLNKEGFENINPVDFERRTRLNKNSSITFYKPMSIFNDSILFLNIDGYKILNLNDAGLNNRIRNAVAPVDLITCIFSTGASGYPLAWQHISDGEKQDILKRACDGRRDMLLQALETYSGNYILPFASHVRLWQPEHRPYLEKLVTNTIDDIVDFFAEHKLSHKLVDILPGETWNCCDGSYTRVWKDRKSLYDKNSMIRNIDKDWEEYSHFSIESHWGTESVKPTKNNVAQYLLNLGNNPDIKLCENTQLSLRVYGNGWDDHKFTVNVQIIENTIRVIDECSNDDVIFRFDIPAKILAPILSGNISWDEARVGYWMRLWRNTEKVYPGLLRLLQGPYNKKEIDKDLLQKRGTTITSTISIASIIESFGKDAERIFYEFGMFCSGCNLSSWESVEDGARKHALSDEETKRLLVSINDLVSNSGRLINLTDVLAGKGAYEQKCA